MHLVNVARASHGFVADRRFTLTTARTSSVCPQGRCGLFNSIHAHSLLSAPAPEALALAHLRCPYTDYAAGLVLRSCDGRGCVGVGRCCVAAAGRSRGGILVLNTRKSLS